jgi:hypothetical protein
MANADGWQQIGVRVPKFAYDHFEKLREDFGDKAGVSPSQPLVVAALALSANQASLKAALLAYRKACKKRGVRHGF